MSFKMFFYFQGTFSDQKSFTQKCMPCTPCKDGEEMYNGCTSSSNYECKPKIITTPAITTTRKIRTTMEEILITGNIFDILCKCILRLNTFIEISLNVWEHKNEMNQVIDIKKLDYNDTFNLKQLLRFNKKSTSHVP